VCVQFPPPLTVYKRYGIEDGIQLERIGLVSKSSFDEGKMILTVTFDSYNTEYFEGQAEEVPETSTRSKTITVTMFQRVAVIGRIKTEKRELDLGLRVAIDATGLKSKPTVLIVPTENTETCDYTNSRAD
jgi:hypothetical protein